MGVIHARVEQNFSMIALNLGCLGVSQRGYCFTLVGQQHACLTLGY